MKHRTFFWFILLVHQSGLRLRFIDATCITLTFSVILAVAAWQAAPSHFRSGSRRAYYLIYLVLFNIVGMLFSYTEELRRRVLFALVTTLAELHMAAYTIQCWVRDKQRSQRQRRFAVE